jgi:hypothetical protein
MKRIIFFILIVSLFSCSEDVDLIKKNTKTGNDETPINDEILIKYLEPLIGTWKATSVTYTSKYKHNNVELNDDFYLYS